MKLPDTIEGCHDLIKQLLVIIEGLQREVQELKGKINQNSRNSSRPPSTDGLKKPGIPVKKGGKAGGQLGHKGKTLKMVADADEVISLKPEVCTGCGHEIAPDVSLYELNRRQVFDLPKVKLQVYEYRRFGCTCKHCGQTNTATFPQGVNAPVQYGNNVKALVTLLHQNSCLPVGKIQALFEDLFGAPMNESTIMSIQKAAYHQLQGEEALIKQALEQEMVSQVDESGIRCEGKLHWLHEIGSRFFTHQFVHVKRGMEAHQEEDALLPRLRNWLIHDCWAPYFKLQNCKHGLCNAHLLRELNAQIEQGRKWAGQFHAFLLDLYEKTDRGKGQLSEKARMSALCKYERLIKSGNKEEPPEQRNSRGRPTKTKGRNLLERLDANWDAVLAFAWHKEVPFTNNQAERDIRPVKSKLKIAGCFRSVQGARAYARIHSFISTVRKHNCNPFNELVMVFNGATPVYRDGK